LNDYFRYYTGRISKFYFYVGAIVAVNSKGEYGMSIACTVFNSYKATTSTVKKWLYKRDSLQRGSLLVFVIVIARSFLGGIIFYL
jgi:hypothetical protein